MLHGIVQYECYCANMATVNPHYALMSSNTNAIYRRHWLYWVFTGYCGKVMGNNTAVYEVI